MAVRAEDRTEIEETLYRYAYLLDTRQHHRVAGEIFTDDAVIDYGTGLLVGQSAVNGFFTGFIEEVAQTAHCYSNCIIKVNGNVAKSHSHVTAWHWVARPDRQVTDEADITIVGASQDEWRRTADGWRISNRVALQFGVAVGKASPGIAELMKGMATRHSTWP